MEDIPGQRYSMLTQLTGANRTSESVLKLTVKDYCSKKNSLSSHNVDTCKKVIGQECVYVGLMISAFVSESSSPYADYTFTFVQIYRNPVN